MVACMQGTIFPLSPSALEPSLRSLDHAPTATLFSFSFAVVAVLHRYYSAPFISDASNLTPPLPLPLARTISALPALATTRIKRGWCSSRCNGRWRAHGFTLCATTHACQVPDLQMCSFFRSTLLRCLLYGQSQMWRAEPRPCCYGWCYCCTSLPYTLGRAPSEISTQGQ
jgi:hypothetical protein